MRLDKILDPIISMTQAKYGVNIYYYYKIETDQLCFSVRKKGKEVHGIISAVKICMTNELYITKFLENLAASIDDMN